ncbi:MAG: hypothetical protein JST81_09130 [Bacteroidetes bacterium]|nr:hypothetical protein [Bacteroidota bacterium]
MRLIIGLLLIVSIVSCNDKKVPDVSHIKIEISSKHFEKDLFALDTNQLGTPLHQLISKYPSFGGLFMSTILVADPRWSEDTVTAYVKNFISSYRPVYDTSQVVFKDFTPYENEIKKALQYLHYYFPQYKLPHYIITYIGPMDGYGDLIIDDAIVVGLHTHLGKNYSAYRSAWVQETYPAYLTQRFEPSYISVNSMKNIVLDMYPEKNDDKSLVVQMVEKGKRLYMLNAILPDKEEYKLIGYTEKQLKDCYAGEGQIWDLFIQNNLLQTLDNNIIKNYVSEGPKTQELGDGSPGNIGSFAGWQIVKKYMAKNPATTLPQLMALDAEKIFSEAKYKP